MLLGVLALMFAYGVIGFMGKMKETSRNRKIAEEKVAELSKQKEKLSSDIGKLQTEEGVEENIREKFGLAKEGEEVIVVVEDKNQLETLPAEPSGFWAWLKSWFE